MSWWPRVSELRPCVLYTEVVKDPGHYGRITTNAVEYQFFDVVSPKLVSGRSVLHSTWTDDSGASVVGFASLTVARAPDQHGLVRYCRGCSPGPEFNDLGAAIRWLTFTPHPRRQLPSTSS